MSDIKITPFLVEDKLDSIELLKLYVKEIIEDNSLTPSEIRECLETAARAKCLRTVS